MTDAGLALQRTLIGEAELVFLALTVWREARGQSRECQVGVAYSIMNRVKNPGWWGNSVCSVLFKRLQYSSMTYKGDPQLTTWPAETDPSWLQCLEVASTVLVEAEENPVPGADSYHDVSIPPPNWASPKSFVRQIGRIRFYNLDRDLEIEDED